MATSISRARQPLSGWHHGEGTQGGTEAEHPQGLELRSGQGPSDPVRRVPGRSGDQAARGRGSERQVHV